MLRLRHGVLPSEILGSVEPAFWPRDAEASASSDASASCYSFAENVGILPVVVPELKLIQVQRQILLADVVVSADDAALEQRPEAFDVVGMDFAANVLILGMLDGFRAAIHPPLADSHSRDVFGRYEAYAVADGLVDETVEGFGVCVLDDLANHVTLPADGSDDAHLAGADPASDVRFLVPMAVLILAADESLIDLDDTHKLFEIFVLHASAEPVADIPSGIQRGTLTEKRPAKLTGRNALFALQYGVENLEPGYERDVSVLENSSDRNREPIGRSLGRSALHTLPMEGPCRSAFVNFGIVAARAARAVRPATHRQICPASRFIEEGRHKFLEGHHA